MDSTTSILVTLKHPHHQYDSEFSILQDFLSISTHSIIYFSPSLSFLFRLSPVMNTFVSHIWRCWIYDCVCRVNASKGQSGINVSSLRIVDVWIMNKYDWTSFKFTLSKRYWTTLHYKVCDYGGTIFVEKEYSILQKQNI